MAYWLIIIILAYLFFALASLCDKLVLAGRPKPNSYTFYVGVFGFIAALFILPFINFGIPTSVALIWIVLDALARILGIYTMYVSLEKFEVSKVIATIGATQPIFIFALTWIFWGPQAMTTSAIFAFALLFLGSIIISFEKNLKITKNFLKITLFSSIMFSLDYIFAKSVFLNAGFLMGIVWIMAFIFLFALAFLLKQKSRKEIFSKQMVSNKKTQTVFLSAQVSGGIANLLQSFAIFLVPVAYLAVVNSLRGIQYVFLFFMALFLSVFFPKIIKEDFSRRIIFQKALSILLIVAGLALLVIY